MFLVYMQMGILFIIIGLVMPTLAKREPNNWIGIRTPLTMSNREAWKQVHRKGWIPFVFAGVASFVALWAVHQLKVEHNMVINLSLIFGIIIVMLIHLFLIIRQVGKSLEVDPAKVDKSKHTQVLEAQQKRVMFVGIIIGVLFVILGIVSPLIGNMGPNPTTGIRTTRSMSSPEAWKEVHQAAMLPMIICGLAIIISSWIIPRMKIKPGMRILIWLVIVILAITIVIMIST